MPLVLQSSSRRGSSLEETVYEEADLAQAFRAEQRRWIGGGPGLVGGGEVGRTQGDGGVEAIREADDEIGVRASSDVEEFDFLAAEGMEGVSDGDVSQRALG